MSDNKPGNGARKALPIYEDSSCLNSPTPDHYAINQHSICTVTACHRTALSSWEARYIASQDQNKLPRNCRMFVL